MRKPNDSLTGNLARAFTEDVYRQVFEPLLYECYKEFRQRQRLSEKASNTDDATVCTNGKSTVRNRRKLSVPVKSKKRSNNLVRP